MSTDKAGEEERMVLKTYIQNLMREMIGAPHILNPFNPGNDGIDRRPPAPPEAE